MLIIILNIFLQNAAELKEIYDQKETKANISMDLLFNHM